jgi:hypothetical protein
MPFAEFKEMARRLVETRALTNNNQTQEVQQ